MTRFLAAFLIWLALTCSAHAEKRVALVIGNGNYASANKLPNPQNDARAVAAALKDVGFEVELGTDLTKRDMEKILRRFAGRLDGAAVGLFYYSGHGLQVNGHNYLAPVDVRLEREADLDFEVIDASVVVRILEAEQRVNLVFLDACRDNPIARNLAGRMGTRSTAVGRGLARINTGLGTLIAFSTAPDEVARDGSGDKSPFTDAFLRHVEKPGLEVRQLLSRVRADVVKETNGEQVPWDNSSLVGDFYFKPPEEEAPAPPAAAAVPASPPAPVAAPASGFDTRQLDLAFWQSIQNSENADDYAAYLAQFPNGAFAPLAKARLDRAKVAASRSSAAPAPIPAPAPPQVAAASPELKATAPAAAPPPPADDGAAKAAEERAAAEKAAREKVEADKAAAKAEAEKAAAKAEAEKEARDKAAAEKAAEKAAADKAAAQKAAAEKAAAEKAEKERLAAEKAAQKEAARVAAAEKAAAEKAAKARAASDQKLAAVVPSPAVPAIAPPPTPAPPPAPVPWRARLECNRVESYGYAAVPIGPFGLGWQVPPGLGSAEGKSGSMRYALSLTKAGAGAHLTGRLMDGGGREFYLDMDVPAADGGYAGSGSARTASAPALPCRFVVRPGNEAVPAASDAAPAPAISKIRPDANTPGGY